MAKISKKEQRAITAATIERYHETTKVQPVVPADLKAGMIILRPQARWRVTSVGEDQHGVFAERVSMWQARGLSVDNATCYTAVRVDDWDTPGADIERADGEQLWVISPDTAFHAYKVESDSIS